MAGPPEIIDALDKVHPRATIGTRWELIADRVMGGVSSGAMTREIIAGRPALRMHGEVSLENNGGFIQVALYLAPGGGAIDARAWTGIETDVFGNDERYNLRLTLFVPGSPIAPTLSRRRSGGRSSCHSRHSNRIGLKRRST